MSESLQGLRGLVTGGGSGIGRAIADCLVREGARVMVVDVDSATSPDVVADVSTTSGVDSVFRSVREQLGGLDLLVNNVGVAGPTAAARDEARGAHAKDRSSSPRRRTTA